MRGVCVEYQRLLRAYERAFVAWVGPGNPDEKRTSNACSDKVERKYQALTDHQQSCAVCLDRLGKEPVRGVGPARLARNLQRRSGSERSQGVVTC